MHTVTHKIWNLLQPPYAWFSRRHALKCFVCTVKGTGHDFGQIKIENKIWPTLWPCPYEIEHANIKK